MNILDSFIPVLSGGYRLEKEFQSALLKEYRRSGNFISVYHIPDIGLSSRLLDVIMIDKTGWTTYLELKIIKGKTFNIHKFEDNQIDLLVQMDKANENTARVGIWSVSENEYKILRFSDIWNAKNEKGGVKLF